MNSLDPHRAPHDARAIFLTTAQLAARWQCSPKKLANDRWAGGGCPYVKIGSLVRYPLDAVERHERIATLSSTSGMTGSENIGRSPKETNGKGGVA